MSAILFSIQSLNNIWMMSIRKCSIGVTRWFYFRPRSVNFPGRCRIAFFFDQYRGIMFFFRGWLMFSMPRKLKHASVARNTTSVELEWKNLADQHYKFWRYTEQKSIIYNKKILSFSVCKKNCTMSAGKYESWLYNNRCRLLYFLFNPWIIFGWCLLGNVWSASSGDAFDF